VRQFLRSLLAPFDRDRSRIQAINTMRTEFRSPVRSRTARHRFAGEQAAVFHGRRRGRGIPGAGAGPAWMGDIYRLLGFSVAYVQQGMSPAERRAAYRADITYSAANEIGFDFIRDRLALDLADQVHRSFAAAVIDRLCKTPASGIRDTSLVCSKAGGPHASPARFGGQPLHCVPHAEDHEYRPVPGDEPPDRRDPGRRDDGAIRAEG